MLLLRHHGPNAAHAPKWPRTKSSEVVDRARDAVVSEGGVGESGEGGHWLRRPRGGPPAPATWIDSHNTDSREREMTCGMFRDVLALATWIDSLNTDSREREMTCIDSRALSEIV